MSKKLDCGMLDSFIKIASSSSGAVTLAYFVAYILANGRALTYDDLVNMLRDNIEQAKNSGNEEHYLEFRLALSFLENAASEFGLKG